jgi:hypothetical protein
VRRGGKPGGGHLPEVQAILHHACFMNGFDYR